MAAGCGVRLGRQHTTVIQNNQKNFGLVATERVNGLVVLDHNTQKYSFRHMLIWR
jgi:hypothetical protein